MVVVPSGKTKTLAQGRVEVTRATMASPTARLLASLRRSTKMVWVIRETEETKGVLESSTLATGEPRQRETTRVSRKEVWGAHTTTGASARGACLPTTLTLKPRAKARAEEVRGPRDIQVGL